MLPPKIAPLWAIPKLPAPAAPVSNAPLATNGHASNPSRKSVMSLALLSPAPAPTKPAAGVKLAMANIQNVPAHLATFGTIRLKNVKI